MRPRLLGLVLSLSFKSVSAQQATIITLYPNLDCPQTQAYNITSTYSGTYNLTVHNQSVQSLKVVQLGPSCTGKAGEHRYVAGTKDYPELTMNFLMQYLSTPTATATTTPPQRG